MQRWFLQWMINNIIIVTSRPKGVQTKDDDN